MEILGSSDGAREDALRRYARSEYYIPAPSTSVSASWELEVGSRVVIQEGEFQGELGQVKLMGQEGAQDEEMAVVNFQATEGLHWVKKQDLQVVDDGAYAILLMLRDLMENTEPTTTRKDMAFEKRQLAWFELHLPRRTRPVRHEAEELGTDEDSEQAKVKKYNRCDVKLTICEADICEKCAKAVCQKDASTHVSWDAIDTDMRVERPGVKWCKEIDRKHVWCLQLVIPTDGQHPHFCSVSRATAYTMRHVALSETLDTEFLPDEWQGAKGNERRSQAVGMLSRGHALLLGLENRGRGGAEGQRGRHQVR